MPNTVPIQPAPPSTESMRALAWELGELRSGDSFLPAICHCALSFVAPRQAFVHFRILASWIDTTAASRGNDWRNCKMLVRLYDVTDVDFNGFNAHAILNTQIQHISAHAFIPLPRSGRMWMAEVGFELSNREFIAAARSQFCLAPSEAPSGRAGTDALYVDSQFNVEPAGSVFDQGAFLEERNRPKMRGQLHIAHFVLEASALGDSGQTATFVSELAAAQATAGHDVHVYMPARETLVSSDVKAGVIYHALELQPSVDPLETASRFATAAQNILEKTSYDLLHFHEWMSAQVLSNLTARPTVLSLASLEVTRLNGAAPTPLSTAISASENKSAALAGLVLVPDWLRPRAISEAGFDASKLAAFPLEGRVASEWDEPLDEGKVKMEMGFGPLDRVLIYIGPLEHESGVDLLFDALPTMLHRNGSVRLALIGSGGLWDSLAARAWNSGASHAIKLLGDVRGDAVARYLRVSEALVLPSRGRVAFDEAVIEMARRAGKPVVTTHGGPAFRVKHEETGIITYDNPGSMVWALDRILGDSAHAARMGLNGKTDAAPRTVSWPELARRYFNLCLERFPALTKDPGVRGSSMGESS